jgi:hypothetical protein
MNCNICSTNAQTVTTWKDSQPQKSKPDIYSIWLCENGHHFYTLSTWVGKHYQTAFVDPKDMQYIKDLL